MSESGQFRDKFALHLAVELLGHDKVIKYLDGKDKQVPLYWRSKLMVSDPLKILRHFGEDMDCIRGRVLFFDVTFEFVKKQEQEQQEGKSSINCDDPPWRAQQPTSSCVILAALGFFLLLPNTIQEFSCGEEKDLGIGGGSYISTRPLDYSQLMSHVDSLQLDPQSVTAEALARSMAGELLRQGPPCTDNKVEKMDRTGQLTAKYVESSKANEENGDLKNSGNLVPKACDSLHSLPKKFDLRVDIPYKSIGNVNGTLLLHSSGDGTVTKYDKNALRFLYWDLSTNANHCHPLQKSDEPAVTAARQVVEDAFNRWRTQIIPNTVSGGDCATDKIKNNIRNLQINLTGDNISQPTTVNSSHTGNNSNKKKRKVFRGASILPSARRKRNRGLVYDKNRG
ncbi:unnamed protein product [Pseudo-nitzschia multistriata]|uniref:Uncharacterized protein n=1 Tax=Pseudo-nitzschia multistriata TaxID=183589 RepID=A0A448Z1D0_9STRA|nr:unnamed protein product [Pseudo-nitzschia multistriata]